MCVQLYVLPIDDSNLEWSTTRKYPLYYWCSLCFNFLPLYSTVEYSIIICTVFIYLTNVLKVLCDIHISLTVYGAQINRPVISSVIGYSTVLNIYCPNIERENVIYSPPETEKQKVRFWCCWLVLAPRAYSRLHKLFPNSGYVAIIDW